MKKEEQESLVQREVAALELGFKSGSDVLATFKEHGITCEIVDIIVRKHGLGLRRNG